MVPRRGMDADVAMANIKRVFGCVSAALFLCLAIVPMRDYFSEWRSIQRSRGLSPAVRQVWLPELGVTDRCSTCHLEPHTSVPHNGERFGCTLCHGGDGVATTSADAHAGMLPARNIEAGCGQCHLDKLPGTPVLNRGRVLLARYRCGNCHGAPRVEAPDLRHIAAKTTREWIYSWIRNPKAYATTATMADFQFSESEARDVSAFLIAQSEPVLVGEAAVGNADDGATLYSESYCTTCHAIENASGVAIGGNLGPELTRIGTKVSAGWLTGFLRDPGATRMPHYRFTDRQLANLVAYLMSNTGGSATPPALMDTGSVPRGRRIVIERGCGSCHAINGIRPPENFAPGLADVGSRPLTKILFVPGVNRDLSSYLTAKIGNPRLFGAQMKMPRYSFSRDDLDAIVTALLAQTARTAVLPAAVRIPGRTQSDYRPAGYAGSLMNELHCLECHSVNGRGGDLAPDLTWEGSAVQRQWLVSFLKDPATIRPSLTSRMPHFNLTGAEAADLADFIRTVYQNPDIPTAAVAGNSTRGRELFYSTYVCQSCHILDDRKDKGYIGPVLASVGSRLNASWIYAYLKNPQALRPGTVEPNRNLTDEDARDLAAFLMGAKK